jgi:hypothetical protein
MAVGLLSSQEDCFLLQHKRGHADGAGREESPRASQMGQTKVPCIVNGRGRLKKKRKHLQEMAASADVPKRLCSKIVQYKYLCQLL